MGESGGVEVFVLGWGEVAGVSDEESGGEGCCGWLVGEEGFEFLALGVAGVCPGGCLGDELA